MIRIIAAALGASLLVASAASAHDPYGYRGSYQSYGGSYQSYSAPVYSSPRYSTAPRYAAPTYTAPIYGSRVYSAPRSYSPPRSRYRHHGYATRTSYAPSHYYLPVSNPYYSRPRNPYTPRSLGPVSDVPSTEGFNIGYSGGPTFGTDQNPIINGVRLRGAPD